MVLRYLKAEAGCICVIKSVASLPPKLRITVFPPDKKWDNKELFNFATSLY